MDKLIDVSLAGLTFSCRLRYSETARYFQAPDNDAIRVIGDAVCLTEDDWRFYLADGMMECANTEFSLLTASFSDALMDYDRLILHAVAIRWQDKAYLIAAESGVGKSTQAKTLQELRLGEFGIICGDRPVLQFGFLCNEESCTEISRNSSNPIETIIDRPKEQKQILVHPSPWNGKERWHGADAAPLGGIILLQRGEKNNLISLKPREAAIRVYAQVIQQCSDPAKVRKAAELTTNILNSIPVWQLTTYQVPDSTQLLLEHVFVKEHASFSSLHDSNHLERGN